MGRDTLLFWKLVREAQALAMDVAQADAVPNAVDQTTRDCMELGYRTVSTSPASPIVAVALRPYKGIYRPSFVRLPFGSHWPRRPRSLYM
jgi:hypothetical protein